MTPDELEAIRRRHELAKNNLFRGRLPEPVERFYDDRSALLAEVDRLKALNESLAARVYAQSELLSKKAEKTDTTALAAQARREGAKYAWTLAVAAVEQYGAWKPLIGHTAVQLVQAARNDHLKELP